ncbi:MAG: alpha/beta hydrolase [Bdellovibrionales bacterium]
MKRIKKILIACAFVYAVVLFGVFVFQRNLLYFSNPSYTRPESAYPGAGIKELTVKTEDGLDLKGWYFPATLKPLTLVYFHGNADRLKSATPIALPYVKAGYGFLIAEYRGYSGLPGSPSEDGLYKDARAFINKLIEKGIKQENIVLLGHSLGSGVATQMATEFNVRGLMLIAPFLSVSEMAQVRFPYFPAQFLAVDKFDNTQKISSLHLPLLIASGGKDLVIPPAQHKKLFELGNEPKQFYFSPESRHNNLFAADLYPVSFKWLDGLVGTKDNAVPVP